jgi:hypothetical protein
LAGCGASEDNSAAASSAAPSSGSLFDDDMKNKSCEMLSAELVASTFNVPADALQQWKIAGCRYGWEDDEQTLEAALSMIRVYDTEEAAASWFANATRNKTAEEMKAEMEKISARMDKSEQLDTELKKSAAKSMLAMIGTKAISFEDVAGIGDEARANDEGNIYVRVGNLTFVVSAYKGAQEPPMDMQGVDLNNMAKVAKETADLWAVETAPQRKLDGTRLARAIVGEL